MESGRPFVRIAMLVAGLAAAAVAGETDPFAAPRRRMVDEDLARGMANALVDGTFGARYVRTLMDQDRFARGLSEPPDPVVTGNRAADDFVVEPHPMESYDALFPTPAVDDESSS